MMFRNITEKRVLQVTLRDDWFVDTPRRVNGGVIVTKAELI
jgi:hypothetical protein